MLSIFAGIFSYSIAGILSTPGDGIITLLMQVNTYLAHISITAAPVLCCGMGGLPGYPAFPLPPPNNFRP